MRPSSDREEWRPVVGYEGIYEVSNCGRVRRAAASKSYPVGYVLTPQTTQFGYWGLLLKNGSKPRHHLIHRLVAAAFIGPEPPGMEVNHKDGNKKNAHVSNLEYVTRSENLYHAYRTGIRKDRGSGSHLSKLTADQVREIRRRLACGVPKKQLAREYGVRFQSIQAIAKRKSWSWL